MLSGLDGVAVMPLATVARPFAPWNADLATAGSTVVADLAGALLPAFESVAGAARQAELVPGGDALAKLARTRLTRAEPVGR